MNPAPCSCRGVMWADRAAGETTVELDRVDTRDAEHRVGHHRFPEVFVKYIPVLIMFRSLGILLILQAYNLLPDLSRSEISRPTGSFSPPARPRSSLPTITRITSPISSTENRGDRGIDIVAQAHPHHPRQCHRIDRGDEQRDADLFPAEHEGEEGRGQDAELYVGQNDPENPLADAGTEATCGKIDPPIDLAQRHRDQHHGKGRDHHGMCDRHPHHRVIADPVIDLGKRGQEEIDGDRRDNGAAPPSATARSRNKGPAWPAGKSTCPD